MSELAVRRLLEGPSVTLSARRVLQRGQLFGNGQHSDFRRLLDTKMSPYLSSHAYQFWRENASAFDTAFYLRGYSGWALRIAGLAIKLAGKQGVVEELCGAQTLEQQRRIWNERLRDSLFGSFLMRLCVSNPCVCFSFLSQFGYANRRTASSSGKPWAYR